MRFLNAARKSLNSIFRVIFVSFLLITSIYANQVLDFEENAVNNSKERIIRLSNKGDLPLEIKGLKLEEENSAFNIKYDSTFTIEGGDSVSIPVVFKPQFTGEKEATLIIESNDPDQKIAHVTIKGTSISKYSAALSGGKPDKFKIHQNYPNPFNSSTTFKYQVPEEEQLNITVYNIRGEKVKAIVNKTTSPGYYKIRWNGKNKYGEKVSSGLYIVRMRAESFNQNIKLTYVK